jgi:hypothetical protein
LHEAIGGTIGLGDVGGADDGDRFALVGDGDGLIGLLNFEAELLEGFREFGSGDGHGVGLNRFASILAILLF